MAAGLRLETMINETLAGNNKKLTEMSGAVLDTILDEKTTLLRSMLLSAQSLSNESESSAELFNQMVAAAQSSQQSTQIEMGQTERLFWVLIFSVMVLVAVGGNTIVVFIVATNKEMKSVTNYFLVNLSLADTMVSTLNVIFNFTSMLNSHWPFGKVYCKISNFIAILSIAASVFTLTAISCDRYSAIIHPLRPRMSHRHAIGWILLIWTLSAALAMPNLIYSTDLEDKLTNDNVAVTCTMLWPDGRYPTSSYDHIYNIIILVVTYLVPILTMAILYYKVGKELWGHEAIGENIDKQQKAIMAKKKIVKMMIVVVIIFTLCWLPYHAFFVLNYYLPDIFSDSPIQYQRGFLLFYWLAMSNSMYNPIIIYFMNSKFRQEIRKILCLICCCCCCSVYKPVLRPSNGTRGTTVTASQQHQRALVSNHQQEAAPAANTNGRRRTNDSIASNQQAEQPPNNELKLNPNPNGTNDISIEIQLNATKQPDEDEPFISINSKQIVNNNQLQCKNLSSSDRLIDFSHRQNNNNNNLDKYTSEKDSQKVWI